MVYKVFCWTHDWFMYVAVTELSCIWIIELASSQTSNLIQALDGMLETLCMPRSLPFDRLCNKINIAPQHVVQYKD